MKNLLDTEVTRQFSTELPADKIEDTISRQVHEACFSYTSTQIPSHPELIHVSTQLMDELGIEIKDKEAFTKVVSGAIPFRDFKPYAMCYGGHQFGGWAGQLGDGRAINIAEVNLNQQNWKFQLKGAGPTPYSRGSDGLAVLRSSIREYLCSEAMHNLGIPTTRALSLVKTGDLVTRDILYNGNPAKENGAIVCRLAPSFIRFGSFEILNARQDVTTLKTLLDYTLNHHFSHLGSPSKENYIRLFGEIATATKKMVLHWQRVGFVHGVMNTDNMSILGLTIDYGPYGWLEDYNHFWTPNTTDIQHKRYRFGNQPSVALWNLTQLANAIYPLIEEVDPLQVILDEFRNSFSIEYHKLMSNKLGLYNESEISDSFLSGLESLLTESEIDYTLFFRLISVEKRLEKLDFLKIVEQTSYLEKSELEDQQEAWIIWHGQYLDYLNSEDARNEERQEKMRKINPKYVLRNYMAQLAIEDAEKGDYNLLDELYLLLQEPYEEQPEKEKWFAKRPEWAKNKVGSSMLSCSS